MRLLFFIDHLGSGGAQRQMVNLATGLKSRGTEIEFCVYHERDFLADFLRASGIPVILERKPSRFSPSVVLALRRRLRKHRYDAVLSFLDTPNFYAELARFGRHRPPLVVSERCSDPAGGPSFYRRFLCQFHRVADAITTNSHHHRESMIRQFPWMRRRITTIYNGVDLARFRPPTTGRTSGSQLRLLTVASISPCKNGLALIRALDVLRRRSRLRPHVSWAGEHQMHLRERRDYSEEMHGAISALGLESQWSWLHERKDIPELMREADALVHPSYFEGVPNAICEALASGLPVLVSNLLDNPRLVQPGKTGLLFDCHDPASIADAIEQMHNLSAAERHRMGEAGRVFAESTVSLDRYVDEYAALFRRVVNNFDRKPRFTSVKPPRPSTETGEASDTANRHVAS